MWYSLIGFKLFVSFFTNGTGKNISENVDLMMIDVLLQGKKNVILKPISLVFLNCVR